MGVSKKKGVYPKMDGENHGKLYFLVDDLGVKLKTPLFFRKHPSHHLRFFTANTCDQSSPYGSAGGGRCHRGGVKGMEMSES